MHYLIDINIMTGKSSTDSSTKASESSFAKTQNGGNTLSEFLLQAHTQYLIFDLGRGIRHIDNQLFFEWENQQSPCEFPRQSHMWSCIVFWNERMSNERYLWFVKLPLDENGLLMQGPRDAFIEIIIQALGKELEHNQDKGAKLPENPYVFTPSQQQLADCNAHIRKHLGLACRDMQKTKAYLQAPTIQSNEHYWQQLSLQDIADFVIYPQPVGNKNISESAAVNARNDIHKGNQHGSYDCIQKSQKIISNNLSHYPQAVLSALFASLESVTLSNEAVDAIIQYHQQTRISNPTLAALALRSMSFKINKKCQQYITDLLYNDSKLDVETCVVLAGRYWVLMADKQILSAYMHKVLAADSSQKLFSALYADLVKIPSIRKAMLEFIRDPARSQVMSEAIGELFASNTGSVDASSVSVASTDSNSTK